MKKEIKTSTNDKNVDLINNDSIRPTTLDSYIGQTQLKKSISILLKSAIARNEMPGHILLYGQPGLGKTTMAYIIANELNKPIVTSVGNVLEKPADIIALLNNITDNSIIFIDEIHRMNAAAEECLYSAMEDGFINILIGEGPQTKNIKLTLPKFTLIGATTKAGMLSTPLRDRFIYQYKMNPYTVEELTDIAKSTCEKLNIFPKSVDLKKIASVSRGVPRAANRYCILVRDYVYANNDGIINENSIENALKISGVFEEGLTSVDIEILNVLNINNIVGIKTLANTIGEDEQTIKEVYEPFLLTKGYISIEPKGRKITEKGKGYIERHGIRN